MEKFCTGCGTQLSDEAKFCPSCGAQQVQAQQPYAPQYQQAYAPAPAAPKKKSKVPLIVGGAVALVVLIAVIALSGRKDSGIDPGGNSGPTMSVSGAGFSNSMNNPGDTSGMNGDKSILGIWTWTESPEKPVEEAGRCIEFKNDGTYYFRYRFHGTVNDSLPYIHSNMQGILTETGKYTVQGNTVRCSNITRSVEITYGDADVGFKNKSYANCDRKFYFADSPHYLYAELGLIPLCIDMQHPSENPDWVPDEYLEFVNPITQENSNGIMGWPKELPSALFPTGLNGTVTTNHIDETISKRLEDHQYVRFTVNVNSKDKNSINPYFEQLRQNGFAFPYGDDSNAVYKSMTICGVRYEVKIDRGSLGLQPDEVIISFELQQYDKPSYDWEWD